MTRFEGPIESHSEVVMLGFDSIEPLELVAAPHFGLGGTAELVEPQPVPFNSLGRRPFIFQLFLCVLAERLEQAVAHAARSGISSEHRLGDQSIQQVEYRFFARLTAHRLDGLDGCPTAKHRQPTEQFPFADF